MDLINCIAFIQREKGKLPDVDYHDQSSVKSRQRAVETLIETIEREIPKARIRLNWNGASVLILGVRSTSTMGITTALGNWIVAARRRLDQTGFIQTSGESENIR